jgi:hypothetical protein
MTERIADLIHALADRVRRLLDRVDPPFDAPRMGQVVIATVDGHAAAFSGNGTVSINQAAPPLPRLGDLRFDCDDWRTRTGIVVKLAERLDEIPAWLQERMA